MIGAKNIWVVSAILSITILLSGCLAAVGAVGVASLAVTGMFGAKFAYPFKTKIVYSITDSGDIFLQAQTWGLPDNAKSYAYAAGAIIGKRRGCNKIKDQTIDFDINFKNLFGKAEGSILFACQGPNGSGTSVSSLLAQYSKEANVLEKENLLVALEGQPTITVQKRILEDEEVRSIQSILKDNGYDPGPADGIWGQNTRKALIEFQQDNDIPITGNLDKETKKALRDI